MERRGRRRRRGWGWEGGGSWRLVLVLVQGRCVLFDLLFLSLFSSFGVSAAGTGSMRGIFQSADDEELVRVRCVFRPRVWDLCAVFLFFCGRPMRSSLVSSPPSEAGSTLNFLSFVDGWLRSFSSTSSLIPVVVCLCLSSSPSLFYPAILIDRVGEHVAFVESFFRNLIFIYIFIYLLPRLHLSSPPHLLLLFAFSSTRWRWWAFMGVGRSGSPCAAGHIRGSSVSILRCHWLELLARCSLLWFLCYRSCFSWIWVL
ncbi:hypothetical protein R3P38DRAFT_1796654 [Favolaschia claudopus]|uniref:Uncharacterized protein n=1 Tax=Favolaschia claudopus TaxID=2862362 RepID=A0AAW0A5F0_9AGAR